MADTNETGGYFDRILDGLFGTASGYFDTVVSDNNRRASEALAQAEAEKAAYVSRLSREGLLGSAQDVINSLPAWFLPATVAGLGFLIFAKYAK